MELTLTETEIKRILLEYINANMSASFNTVELRMYTYPPKAVFTVKEPQDAAQ